MKLFCLILYKCRKLRLHLVNSKLILFEEKIHLTHLHGLILKGGQPFWVSQPDLCPGTVKEWLLKGEKLCHDGSQGPHNLKSTRAL
jgi:hypothetical protein